jgi:23S rRNA (uracil1939-C5)-methyltransferase
MGRRKKVLEELFIERVAAEGKCVAKNNGQVVFVSEVAPGDVVDVRITKKKKSHLEGFPIHFHRLSGLRIEPFCSHFADCGGCKWQHLPYATQLEFKQQQVVDQFQRIGKLDYPGVQPILGSEKQTYYRNKLEFTFTSNRWLTRQEIESGENLNRNAAGFHKPGAFNKVLDIEHCYLQSDPSNAIRNGLANFADEHNIPFYNLENHTGMIRNLVIRTTSTGETMVIVQFGKDAQEDVIQQVMQYLEGYFTEINSLNYVYNPKRNDTFNDLKVVCFSGLPYITEEMEGLHFRIGPKSFYQTNSQQAYELYKVARSFARLTGKETVYDLYTGTGTIAQFVAKDARQVVGLEYVPEAIEDARENARLNNITNASFYAGDVKALLTPGFIESNGYPDVLITDPPRAGMHRDVVQTILEVGPGRIVYVSCNPATQARDLALLTENYRITDVQPVDMFPQTHHVENVVALEKR